MSRCVMSGLAAFRVEEALEAGVSRPAVDPGVSQEAPRPRPGPRDAWSAIADYISTGIGWGAIDSLQSKAQFAYRARTV